MFYQIYKLFSTFLTVNKSKCFYPWHFFWHLIIKKLWIILLAASPPRWVQFCQFCWLYFRLDKADLSVPVIQTLQAFMSSLPKECAAGIADHMITMLESTGGAVDRLSLAVVTSAAICGHLEEQNLARCLDTLLAWREENIYLFTWYLLLSFSLSTIFIILYKNIYSLFYNNIFILCFLIFF